MRRVVLLVALAGCGKSEPTPTEPAPGPPPKPAPVAPKPAESVPQPSVPQPGPGKDDPPPKKVEEQPKPKPKPEAPKPKVWTFDAAWDAAQEMGEFLDEKEPQKTAEALKLLTAAERMEAEFNARIKTPGVETLRDMTRLGCRAWAERKSRAAAWEDKDFRPVARALWGPPAAPGGILATANAWGFIDPLDRRLVAHAVKNNTPTANLQPETRDAILRLGGAGWLKR